MIPIPHSTTDQLAQPNPYPTHPSLPTPHLALPFLFHFSTFSMLKVPNVTYPTLGAHDVNIPAKCPREIGTLGIN